MRRNPALGKPGVFHALVAGALCLRDAGEGTNSKSRLWLVHRMMERLAGALPGGPRRRYHQYDRREHVQDPGGSQHALPPPATGASLTISAGAGAARTVRSGQ